MLVFDVNWTNISGDWIGWLSTGYEYVFGNWLYPILFLGIIGYVYAVNRSAISAAAAICIIFTVFGTTGVLSHPDTSMFGLVSVAIVVFSVAGLFLLVIFEKNRRS